MLNNQDYQVVETSTGNPYTDEKHTNYFIREFSDEVNEQELIWHRDKKDREIVVLSGEGWKLQMDNELPKELEKDKVYHIEKLEYHRLLKGQGNLKLKIIER